MPRPKVTPVYVGIDPGASGGLACLSGTAVEVAPVGGMTWRQVWDWVLEFAGPDRPVRHAAIEKVGGYVGGNKLPGSAMFNFGKSAGLLTMALVAAGVPFSEVTPQAWQKAVGVTPAGKARTKADHKRLLKNRAEQLFPDVNVTLATADALLLAYFCKIKHSGVGYA